MKSLWTWFGLDLILKWMTWWLGGRLIVSDGRDRLSTPRLLQDLTIIELVRRWMDSDWTCECTCGDVRHPWQQWLQSRFGEFVRMTNWWPRLGVMTKFWTSILTVESQLVGTFDAKNGSHNKRKGSRTFDCHHWRYWSQCAWAHKLLQYLVQDATEDRITSTAAGCAQETVLNMGRSAKMSEKCAEMKIITN